MRSQSIFLFTAFLVMLFNSFACSTIEKEKIQQVQKPAIVSYVGEIHSGTTGITESIFRYMDKKFALKLYEVTRKELRRLGWKALSYKKMTNNRKYRELVRYRARRFKTFRRLDKTSAKMSLPRLMNSNDLSSSIRRKKALKALSADALIEIEFTISPKSGFWQSVGLGLMEVDRDLFDYKHYEASVHITAYDGKSNRPIWTSFSWGQSSDEQTLTVSGISIDGKRKKAILSAYRNALSSLVDDALE